MCRRPHVCLCLLVWVGVQAPCVDSVQTIFAEGVAERLQGQVDVLLFNPPYVPSSAEEVPAPTRGEHIDAAWAGGPRGRQVVDAFLPQVPALLSRPHGCFFLLAMRENDPADIVRQLAPHGLQGSVVARRQGGGEDLCVLLFQWEGEGEGGGGGSEVK
mgnify:CR=1 FL=1